MSNPYKFLSDLGQTHLIGSISMLFNHDEELCQFFFSHKNRALRIPAKNLIQQASCYPLEDQLMIRVALDFWNRRGAARLADLLTEWSPELWIRFIRALCHLEEIEADTRDALWAVTKHEPVYPPVIPPGTDE